MQPWSTTLCLPMGARLRVLLTLVLAGGAWALLSALSSPAAHAAPAAPELGTTTQPDGTAFQSRVFGDEWANGIETAAGYTVVENQAGVWEYAARAPGNRLRPSGRVVGRDRPGNLPKHLRDQVAAAQGAALAEAAPLPQPTSPDAMPALAPQSIGAATTTHRNLVILAAFNDQASLGTTPASWNDRFFGASGSLTDYYQEVSYGAFAVEPATESSGTADDGIVGWLTLDMPHPNGDMEAARRMVKAAVEAADATVDFAPFDSDGNGILIPSELHITVIAAGLEGSYPGTGMKVWGHRWSLQPGVVEPPVADGVSVANMYYGGGYTAFGEMHDDHQATVGIIAHEFGHDIGLPDLYDTDRTSNGVGKWSVMGSGSWLQTGAAHQGTTPAHADAWSKWYLGWITPNLVTTSSTAQPVNAASSLTNSDVALQLGANPGGPTDWRHNYDTGSGEYFLVENRQRTAGTFDAGLPGDGLLVWHINEASRDNTTDADRLVDLLEADGLAQLDLTDPMGQYRGDAGDPYPGTANKRSASSTTTPNTKLNVSGAYSGVTIEAISDSGATMTADVRLPGTNDTFAGATAMAGRSSTRTNRITEATRDTGEPTACGVDRSVWFTYTAPASGTVALSTAGSPFDTALGVFTGSTVGDLATVACIDDAGGATTSALSFAASAGTTYYVQAGNDVSAPASVGDLTLSMQSSPTAPTQVWASTTEGTTTVGWSPPLSDGGSAITGYTITALPSGATTTVPVGTTQTTIAGLTSGLAATFTVTASNDVGEGPASIASNAVTPIANAAPLVTMVAPNRTFTLTNTVVARWTAADASGVAAHDVRWRLAPAGGAFGSWVYDPAWQGLTTAKAPLGSTQAGYTYCFSVRSTDTVGNTSGWTAPRCTTTPVDDRDLAPSAGGWSSKTALASYRATFRLSKLSGATLTLPSVRTKQVWLVATRCPGCGTVTVTVAGVKTRVPLDHSTTQRKRLFPIATYATAKTVKVTVKVVSAGAGVPIDGLAATTQ